jgi:hypothetical protein
MGDILPDFATNKAARQKTQDPRLGIAQVVEACFFLLRGVCVSLLANSVILYQIWSEKSIEINKKKSVT